MKDDHCIPDRWASSLTMLGVIYRNVSLCLTVQGATGGAARILTMGSRKPHSWLLTPMIEGIELNVFRVNSFRGSSGKKKPSTTRVKDLVFWNKNRKIRHCLCSPNLLSPNPSQPEPTYSSKIHKERKNKPHMAHSKTSVLAGQPCHFLWQWGSNSLCLSFLIC